VANEELFIEFFCYQPYAATRRRHLTPDPFAKNIEPRCGEEYSQNTFLLRAFSRAAAKAFNS
jgi:hypothetical protein